MSVIDARKRFQGAQCFSEHAVTPEGKPQRKELLDVPVSPSTVLFKIKRRPRNWFKYILTMLGK